jgi:HEAT repeat protein
LKSLDARTRLAALLAIEATGDSEQIASKIQGLLKDSNRDVRLKAAGVLVGLGEHKEAQPVLQEIFKGGSTLERRQVCRLLGLVAANAKAADPAFKTTVEDLLNVLKDAKVRTDASNALIKIGKRAADMIATKMTRIEDDRARLECLYILGQINHTSTLVGRALLIIAYSDPSDENQEEAWRLISKLSGGNIPVPELKNSIRLDG